MAKSKPSSPRGRPARMLALIRPSVRASIPPPPNAFELPDRMDIDHDIDPRPQAQSSHDHIVSNRVGEQSTGSLPTSRSTTEPSSSSAILDDQRHLSALFTPSVSEASNSEHGASTSRATANLVTARGRGLKRARSATIEHVTASIDETLLGQGRWVPILLDTVQDVEFVGGRPPDELPQPQGLSPWSGLRRPHDEGGSASPTERRGGRRGGFGKEKASKVGQMRQTKACLRCVIYRIECDDGKECRPCGRKMRTWTLPCTRERLPERLKYLFPGILTDHLQFERVKSFLETNAMNYLPGPKKLFHIPLTQFLDEGNSKYLWVQVREFEPLGSRLLERPGFMAMDGQVHMVKRHSPPVMPVIDNWTQTATEVSAVLRLWLLRFFEGKDTGWQLYMFPKPAEQVWERNILGQICSLLDPEKEEHGKLEAAMELTFFTYLFTHSFAVPDEEIPLLYDQRLQHPDYRGLRPPPDTEVTPHAVNRFLAMIVLRKVQGQAETTLEHINKLFASRDDSVLTGVLAFCESFLFVMVLAQLQRSILQRAQLKGEVYETTIEVDEARRLIKKLEDELATPIVELCVFKLRKVAKKSKAKASNQSGDVAEASVDELSRQFCNNLHKITELCGKSHRPQTYTGDAKQEAGQDLSRHTELCEIDEQTFGALNVQRLLRRLYFAAIPFLPPTGPSEVVLK